LEKRSVKLIWKKETIAAHFFVLEGKVWCLTVFQRRNFYPRKSVGNIKSFFYTCIKSSSHFQLSELGVTNTLLRYL